VKTIDKSAALSGLPAIHCRSSHFRLLAVISILAAANSCPVVYADYQGGTGTTTLRNPLIQGASSAAAGQPAPLGAPPPQGSGDTPIGVTPGMTGSPTYEPWASRIPANQIDQSDSSVSLPFSQADALPPGVAGQIGNPPAPPSTPGVDQGMLRNPTDAVIINVPSTGIYPDNQAPITPRGGQYTRDFGLPTQSSARTGEMRGDNPNRSMDGSITTDFGQRLEDKDIAVAPQYSQDGSIPVLGQANNTPPQITHDLGMPMLMKGSGNQFQTPLTTIAPQ
jgi:hypothetical protein